MVDRKVVVQVQNLTKSFRVPLEATGSIKQKIVNGIKRRKGYREFTPLKDISFEIETGEFFGIVGRNGSGKSTLLKTLANIYTPNQGSVQVHGTLIPFIELGVGFNPELTGRENVYLNGALLGLSHRQVEDMYDDIVEFAELHDFMDERLKNYSSGMQVRLAFSIAIRADGDVLLLDEVLAVGDEAFQRKCFEYFEELRAKKKTVILVTHDMASVERFCTRAMLINEGEILLIGKPHKVAGEYSRLNQPLEKEEKPQQKSRKKTSISVMIHKNGTPSRRFIHGERMSVTLEWPQENIQHVGVSIIRQDGTYVYGTNTYQEDKPLPRNSHSAQYDLVLNLSEGKYFIKAGLFGINDTEIIDFEEQGPSFRVYRDTDKYRWGGITELEHAWSLPRTKSNR